MHFHLNLIRGKKARSNTTSADGFVPLDGNGDGSSISSAAEKRGQRQRGMSLASHSGGTTVKTPPATATNSSKNNNDNNESRFRVTRTSRPTTPYHYPLPSPDATAGGGNAAVGNRMRGVSNASSVLLASSPPGTPRRPLSGVYFTGGAADSSMAAEANLAMMETELEQLMEEMGLSEDRKQIMRMMPPDQKRTIISSRHKRSDVYQEALVHHAKILADRSIQHIPSSRIDRLRVDLRVQSINRIQGFVKEKGLVSLINHANDLSQKSRRDLPRRRDELNKEYNLICCIQSILRINEGMEALLGSPLLLCHLLNSIDSPWVPTCTLVLRIIASIIKHDPPATTEYLLHCLFKPLEPGNDEYNSGEGGYPLRSHDSPLTHTPDAYIAFNRWWIRFIDIAQTFSSTTPPSLKSHHKSDTTIIDYTITSLSVITQIMGNLPDLFLRVRIYERLHQHQIHAQLPQLYAWRSNKLNDTLHKWYLVVHTIHQGVLDKTVPGDNRADSQGDNSISWHQSVTGVEANTYSQFLAHYNQNASLASEASLTPFSLDQDGKIALQTANSVISLSNLATFDAAAATPPPGNTPKTEHSSPRLDSDPGFDAPAAAAHIDESFSPSQSKTNPFAAPANKTALGEDGDCAKSGNEQQAIDTGTAGLLVHDLCGLVRSQLDNSVKAMKSLNLQLSSVDTMNPFVHRGSYGNDSDYGKALLSRRVLASTTGELERLIAQLNEEYQRMLAGLALKRGQQSMGTADDTADNSTPSSSTRSNDAASTAAVQDERPPEHRLAAANICIG